MIIWLLKYYLVKFYFLKLTNIISTVNRNLMNTVTTTVTVTVTLKSYYPIKWLFNLLLTGFNFFLSILTLSLLNAFY